MHSVESGRSVKAEGSALILPEPSVPGTWPTWGEGKRELERRDGKCWREQGGAMGGRGGAERSVLGVRPNLSMICSPFRKLCQSSLHVATSP